MGCFLVGVTGHGWSAEGEAFVAGVSDDPYDVRTFVKLDKPRRGLAHVGTELISTTEHDLMERGYFARPGETTRGVNEAGLAFTCAMVIENEELEKPRDSTPYADVTTRLMKTCESVEQALALFESAGAINPAYSVLLADAGGDLAHIEVGNYGMAVVAWYTQGRPGAVHAVNCYLAPPLVEYNAPHTLLGNLKNNNTVRLERGRELTERFRGELGVGTIAQILSDHANRERDPMSNPIFEAGGFSICNHGTRSMETYPEEDLPWGTVSAEIMQPAKRLLWYAYGWPCGEEPEFGDQIFQPGSWGRFIPFTAQISSAHEVGITQLTNPNGGIETRGVRYLPPFY